MNLKYIINKDKLSIAYGNKFKFPIDNYSVIDKDGKVNKVEKWLFDAFWHEYHK